MATSLAEAALNAVDDVDVAVIDSFRKESTILDSLVFDDVVNPAGGGAVLTYGYRRLISQPTAATRAINSEYAPAEVSTQVFTTSLAVMGGSFEVDRVVAKVGPSASSAVTLNLQQKIKATKTLFQDLVINGDTSTDANSFDGLDKALAGSSTEVNADVVTDWTAIQSGDDSAFKVLDVVDEFLSYITDGAPTIILGNKYALSKLRAAARRASMHTIDPVAGLIGIDGRPIVRETYGGIVFADPGEQAGTSNLIIPVETRTVGGTSTTGLTDLYAYRVGMDGFKGLSTVGGQLVQTWLPRFDLPDAVHKGEVELGPVGVALMSTKSAAVLRNVKVQ